MAANHIVGAVAPGPVTLRSDNAPWQGRVEGNGKADNRDSARTAPNDKARAKLTARAALLGLEPVPISDGRWRLIAGQKATVYASLQAVTGIVVEVELVQGELASLVRQRRVAA